MEQAIEACVPDYVIHLAAQSYVPQSFADQKTTYDINFYGTYNILSALKKNGFGGRFLFVSTGDVYGLVDSNELPVNEDNKIRPRNPYSVSKVAAEALCYQWSQTEKFEILIVRPFNHIGPGQSEKFVVSSFAKQVVEIKNAKKEPFISVGDIEVTRDFTDVRDIVQAYDLLLDKGRNGEIYNVCSGKEYKIGSILMQLIELAGIDAEIKVDESKLRYSEQRRMQGSYEKLTKETKWKPEIELKTSLNDILKYWEKQSR
jgi:GDP-4-dehydro-6-deoxy-D-mannose reductase